MYREFRAYGHVPYHADLKAVEQYSHRQVARNLLTFWTRPRVTRIPSPSTVPALGGPAELTTNFPRRFVTDEKHDMRFPLC
jgi:hypothetical protein